MFFLTTWGLGQILPPIQVRSPTPATYLWVFLVPSVTPSVTQRGGGALNLKRGHSDLHQSPGQVNTDPRRAPLRRG